MSSSSRPLRVLFVRHGQSELNTYKDGVIRGGMPQSPLTPLGEQQAACLGQYLANIKRIKFDLVFSSPAVRARRTAELSCAQMAACACEADGTADRSHSSSCASRKTSSSSVNDTSSVSGIRFFDSLLEFEEAGGPSGDWFGKKRSEVSVIGECRDPMTALVVTMGLEWSVLLCRRNVVHLLIKEKTF